MSFIANNGIPQGSAKTSLNPKLPKRKNWKKILLIAAVIIVVIGGFLAWKTDSTLRKISGGGILSSITHSLPGIDDSINGEKDGRVNVLILGMRGANLPGGGTLADTIMVASLQIKENKVAMISIPRDLYVTVPGTSDRQKINAVHAYGEQKGEGKGMEDMKIAVGEVLGIPIHYAMRTDFAGFKQLIDAIGGIEITLSQPFDESIQFNQPHVCDTFFTIPTGQFENKYKHKKDGRVQLVAQYPLCSAPKETLECGGNFKLPAGTQILSGDQALCFARSRYATSDFERAKRQQEIIQLVKQKLLSSGTFMDFNKLNGILNSLGNNVRTDLQAWEMKRLYEIYAAMNNPQLYQRVLENSTEGMLYHPAETKETGYILLPIGDNYDKIHDMAKNIFNIAPQSNVKPKI